MRYCGSTLTDSVQTRSSSVSIGFRWHANLGKVYGVSRQAPLTFKDATDLIKSADHEAFKPSSAERDQFVIGRAANVNVGIVRVAFKSAGSSSKEPYYFFLATGIFDSIGATLKPRPPVPFITIGSPKNYLSADPALMEEGQFSVKTGSPWFPSNAEALAPILGACGVLDASEVAFEGAIGDLAKIWNEPGFQYEKANQMVETLEHSRSINKLARWNYEKLNKAAIVGRVHDSLSDKKGNKSLLIRSMFIQEI